MVIITNGITMVTNFYEIFLAGKSALSSVGPKTMPLNFVRAPRILYDNSRGHMFKSAVIDTFWHTYQRVAHWQLCMSN